MVLDVGAGTGILTQLARQVRKDFTHVCIDPAPGMLKFVPFYAQKVGGKAEALPFRDGAFDAILIGDAFHHLNNPSRAISEIKRCLDEKGVLFIFDIDPGKLMGKFICRLEVFLDEPALFYAPTEFQRLLTGHGFSVKIRNYGWRFAIIASIAKRS